VTIAAYTLPSNIEILHFYSDGYSEYTGLGNATDNFMFSDMGAVNFSGLGGNDTLLGGTGDSTLAGGGGNDPLEAGGRNDSLAGGTGLDTLTGGYGNDTLDGGASADAMAGGLGDDTYIVAQATDVVTENTDEGMDTVEALLSAYTLPSNIENLIYIGATKIKALGNALDNLMSGGSGNDSLTGGTGADTITGGAGADHFIFRPGDFAAGPVLDEITDFNHAQLDKIDLKLIDANSNTPAANETFLFIGSGAFTHVARQLHYVVNGSGGVTVEGDTNGDGAADFQFTVDGASSLVAADFVL